jgi:hypothetical protein
MAFKRKKVKDSTGAFLKEPRRCYICKEKKAFHSMHGGYVGHYHNYGGKMCCDECAPGVRAEEERLARREGDPNDLSEGEYQAYGQFES